LDDTTLSGAECYSCRIAALLGKKLRIMPKSKQNLPLSVSKYSNRIATQAGIRDTAGAVGDPENGADS